MNLIEGKPTLIFELKVNRDSCRHLRLMIDPSLTYVECANCGEKLNPVWVLERMIKEASQWKNSLIEYRKIVEKLEKKRRTKCEHCGKFTSVNT